MEVAFAILGCLSVVVLVIQNPVSKYLVEERGYVGVVVDGFLLKPMPLWQPVRRDRSAGQTRSTLPRRARLDHVLARALVRVQEARR
jgi:hypothetical protein